MSVASINTIAIGDIAKINNKEITDVANIGGVVVSPSGFSPLAVNFDGAGFFYNSSAFDGLSNAAAATVSCWAKLEVETITNNIKIFCLSQGSSPQLEVYVTSSNTISVIGRGSTTQRFWFYTESDTFLDDGLYHHIFAAYNSTGVGYLYIDGVQITHSIVANGGSISFANANRNAIGALWNGSLSSNKFIGSIAEIWCTNEYLDPATYLAAFISDGKPVNLGVDGSAPGITPKLYFSVREGDTVNDFALNRGSSATDFSINTSPGDSPSLISPSPWA